MSTYEYIGNAHVHTTYSDGTALHEEVAQAAGEAGLNFVITTDHNVWVNGVEGYYGRVLLLVGEELHNVRQRPQANHLLVYHAEEELAPVESSPQQVINRANERGGLCFLAHPFEYGGSIGRDLDAIPWHDWDVSGYAGLEIWNYMSEFKSLMRNKLAALIYGNAPDWGITGPFRATLQQWDQLLAQGIRLAAIGGADAHGQSYSMGSMERVVFPYSYLFRCVNTHILTDQPLNGTLEHDKELIYGALRAGHTWVGYDLLGSTTGFRFSARSGSNQALMGDVLKRTGATVFEVQTPQRASIRLLCNGATIASTSGQSLRFTSAEPGAYRVEATRGHKLGQRGWIFSSAIMVR